MRSEFPSRLRAHRGGSWHHNSLSASATTCDRSYGVPGWPSHLRSVRLARRAS